MACINHCDIQWFVSLTKVGTTSSSLEATRFSTYIPIKGFLFRVMNSTQQITKYTSEKGSCLHTLPNITEERRCIRFCHEGRQPSGVHHLGASRHLAAQPCYYTPAVSHPCCCTSRLSASSSARHRLQ